MDKMDTIIISVILALALLIPSAYSARMSVRHREESPCPEQHYIHLVTHECTPCSECPVDEIIRSPCTYHQDTVCGPFYEFEFFNINGPSHRDQLQTDGDGTAAIRNNAMADGSPNNQDPHNSPGVSTVGGEEDTWRNLCYGLMGALLLLFLAAIVYVFFLTVQRRRRMHELSGKTITVADPSDPTVYYQAQIITASPMTSSTSSATTSPYSTSPDQSRRSASESTSSLSRFSLLEGHLRRMLSGGRSNGNVYVDPTGRVYTRKDNGERVDEEDTHPFVRVDNGLPLVHGPIYVGGRSCVPASNV